MTDSKLWSPRSVRLRVACVIALALTIEGLMRSNLNMAIVCMLNETALTDGKPLIFDKNSSVEISHISKPSCPLLTLGSGKSEPPKGGTIFWTSQDRASIFASFYVGGLAATVVSEYLNRYVGSTRTVLYGGIANVVGTFLTPFVASQTNFGTVPIILLRFVMGFGQGVLWPCMSVLIAQWFPANEKSTALAIATTGNQLSVVIALFVTAEMCQLPWGWPMAFHIYAVFGVFMCAAWWYVVRDSPLDANISKEELQHITTLRKRARPTKANWSALLCSPVVWAVAASSFAHNYVTVGTVTYLPIYYKTVLNMSLTSNGLLSALPFIIQFIAKVIYAGFADKAKSCRWMSGESVTKLCNSSASFGIGICFGLLCFCDCSQRAFAIFLVCGAMAFVSGYIPGYNTSVVTIAPSQTAAIAAFTRIWAQVASSLAPYHIGAYTKNGTFEEWRYVFLIIAAICFFSGLFFQLYGTSSIQEWDSDTKEPLEIAHEELIDSSKLDDSTRVTTVE